MGDKCPNYIHKKFMRSAILPLRRKYRVDRVFSRKTLNVDWLTDTMDVRFKSAEGKIYSQVFANKSYFARLYPMDSKRKAGDALRLFCQEFGVQERLTLKGKEFMKQIRSHIINYHVCEPNHHNKKPIEGVIHEIRRK